MSLRVDPLATHEVRNQPPPLVDVDLFAMHPVLEEAVCRHGAGWAVDDLHALGRTGGSAEVQRWAAEANASPPVLRTHDRYGHRVDEVDYHPSYHALMRTAVTHGVHAAPWSPDARPGSHVARGAKMHLWWQVEPSHTCPISMTYSVVPALRHQPDLAECWEPGLERSVYDPTFAPPARKDGLIAGMAMTEKQGGSDVRANTTRAEPVGGGGPGAEHVLTGHKWFCSAPMSDAFLVLAQAPKGLSCFLVPRWTPDGERNVFRIQRLKDKLGDRANASSEIELAGTWAVMVGEEGRGVRTIIEMVNHTRLDCTLGSSGGMHLGVVQALHHARHRSAFGRVLLEQPLMRNVLADLAIEAEAATLLALRLAAAHDPALVDEHDVAFRRVATPVAKYWVCKRAPGHAAEALECFGGAGYVEESGMPRLFRQSPLNGIWEGSGNVMCLDVLRAAARSPEAVEAFVAELDLASGADRRYDAAVAQVKAELSDFDDLEGRARRVVEAMAITLQASCVLRWSPPAVADAFCAGRLDGGGRVYGTLPRGVDLDGVLTRASAGLP